MSATIKCLHFTHRHRSFSAIIECMDRHAHSRDDPHTPTMTNTNKNDKAMQSEASDRRADRLAEEINILRLEGVLFCFDPREARQHNGKLKFMDTLKKPVTIDINPNYGRPSV